MSKRCKITVEIDGNISTYEYDNMKITQERGMEIAYTSGSSCPTDIRPNGQERITIFAWSGTTDFDDFEKETTKIV